jgi:hypothetical protein
LRPQATICSHTAHRQQSSFGSPYVSSGYCFSAVTAAVLSIPWRLVVTYADGMSNPTILKTINHHHHHHQSLAAVRRDSSTRRFTPRPKFFYEPADRIASNGLHNNGMALTPQRYPSRATPSTEEIRKWHN